jgi:hypothetical protein
MIAGSLLTLWCNSSLKVVLWLAVLKFLPLVELLSFLLEVLFHHINVVLVVLLVDSWVLPDEDTKLMKGLSN